VGAYQGDFAAALEGFELLESVAGRLHSRNEKSLPEL
jgi:hypothetical protein